MNSIKLHLATSVVTDKGAGNLINTRRSGGDNHQFPRAQRAKMPPPTLSR